MGDKAEDGMQERRNVQFYGDPSAREALGSLRRRWLEGSGGHRSTPGRTSRGAMGPAAVALVRDGVLAVASVNAPLGADYEIGSVSKGLTGLLYADAVDRGELDGATTLGDLLPLQDCGPAKVTLGSVSRHASGLPRLATSQSTVQRTLALWLRGANPYGETLEELLAQARTTRLQSPRPRYSNFGFELLGHAVAAGAGATYRELMARRITGPLGLASLYAPASTGELQQAALPGRSRYGRIMQPWTGEALAPAGGWRATIGDMGELARALLHGHAPGVSALDPVADFAGPAARIGAAWLSLDVKGHTVTLHSGATGGFRSWMGLDRKAGTGVVLLSASSAPLDRHGFRLLLHQPR
ncbi:serine hydrolase domain-containing protein [Pseudarthrobacter sp. NPDC058329]|uniref:serine hydrolase domain-containing protein n=1 Tax=Pseudarthrobacter sp. NPDC058329 TaxID=3346448 RepID=UPI0036DC87A4